MLDSGSFLFDGYSEIVNWSKLALDYPARSVAADPGE